MAKTIDLVKEMKRQDLTIQSNHVDTNKAIRALTSAGLVTPKPAPHPSELDLTDPNEDPFGGNSNNRRVAERILAHGKRIYHNANKPIHLGDPVKAAADIAKSKTIVPDDEVVDEVETIVDRKPLPAPSLGSPAALKAAEAAAKAGKVAPTSEPAPWKPGA